MSGYFYHRRGAEHWCELPNPNDIDWLMVNGAVPAGLPEGMTLTGYLNSVSLEEGLLAELEFRRHHFASMRLWPISDPRIRLFKYEEIIGRESEVFGEICRFFELPFSARLAGPYYARRYRAGQKSSKSTHIRNPNAGQWREYFTPRLRQKFLDSYGDILERYHYPLV